MNIIQSLIDNIKRCTIDAYEKFITEDIAKSINVRNFTPKFNEKNQLVEDLEIDLEESLKILNYVLNNNLDNIYFNYRNVAKDFLKAIDDYYYLSMENPSEIKIVKNVSTILKYFSTEEFCKKFNIPNIHDEYSCGDLYYGVIYSTKNILDFLDFMLENQENFNFETEYNNVKENLVVKDVYNGFKDFIENKKIDEIMIYSNIDNNKIKECDSYVFDEAWIYFANKAELKKHKLPIYDEEYYFENLFDNNLSIENMLKIIKIVNKHYNIEKFKILEQRLELLKECK